MKKSALKFFSHERPGLARPKLSGLVKEQLRESKMWTLKESSVDTISLDIYWGKWSN